MYQPPHFREDRIEVQHALIRSHPLGLVITSGPSGLLANPVPCLVDPDASPHGTLRLHFARANPHLRDLAAVEQCLVVFQGPQQYITPSWYPTKRESGRVVPTWNYITVHAWGRPKVIDDVGWLRRQVDDLTLQNEGGRPEPWKVDDAPQPFVASQLKAIVGVEIPIDRIEGKWKVSQNRIEADRRGVADALRREGGEAALAMSALVAERLAKSSSEL